MNAFRNREIDFVFCSWNDVWLETGESVRDSWVLRDSAGRYTRPYNLQLRKVEMIPTKESISIIFESALY